MTYDDYLRDEASLLAAALVDSYVSRFINRDHDVVMEDRDYGDGRRAQVQMFRDGALKRIAKELYLDFSRQLKDRGVNFEELVCEQFNYCEEIQKGTKSAVLERLEESLKNRLQLVGITIMDLTVSGGLGIVLILSILGAADHFNKLCQCD